MDILCVLKAIGTGIPVAIGILGLIWLSSYNDRYDYVSNQRLHRVLTIASGALQAILVVGLVVMICLVIGLVVLGIIESHC